MKNAFQQAVKALRSNLVRTTLTTLGIIIGIAMVILVLAAGEGFRGYINSQIETFGTNIVSIETRVPPTTKSRNNTGQGIQNSSANQAVAITTLKMRDVTDIKRLNNVVNAYGAVIGQQVTSYKDVKKNAFIFGADTERFRVDKGVLKSGRPYTDQENAAAAQVAILGYDIASDLFREEDPIGKTVRVGTYNFLVIGVYERRGSFGFSNDDQQVFVPLNTAQKKLLGIDYLFYIIGQLEDQNLAVATAEDIRIALRSNHDIADPVKDDFFVTTQAQALDSLSTILAGISFLLIAIATISLVVGGVGIMNIMYVVVTERTSEIGLKKAVGAKQKDILLEFLVEAILVTIAGGILGILTGGTLAYGIARIAQAFNFAWAFKVPLSGILLGLGVSGSIGLIFGVFPARKAARLDPIEALRFE